MRKSKFSFVLLVVIFLIFLISFNLVHSFQGSSSSYTTDVKTDSYSQGNSSSTSFTQRFIGGIQVVGQYLTNSFLGRFGILDIEKNLAINITSHKNNQEISRGNDAVSGEDDKGYVPNSINFTARVFENGTNIGFSGANCFFYDNGIFFGNSSTNSSGHCTFNFSKSLLSVDNRALFVNYSIITSDTILVSSSQINYSIVRYVSKLTMGNLRDNGKYYNGDSATLTINITKINQTGTFMYDPLNISANATNAAQIVYPGGSSFYPGNISRTQTGMYSANVTVNYSFGSHVRWDVLVSDNNFSDFLSTAVHADKDICSGDFSGWSEWSACSGGTQTSSRTDSSGCSEVQTQSCGGGESCFPAGTKILLFNGSYKNIEDIGVGEHVISYNEISKNNEVSEVLEIESPVRDHMCIIIFSDSSELNLTSEHPIYSKTGWKSINPEATKKEKPYMDFVEKLSVGDLILSSNLDYREVKNISCWNETIQTYNLKSVSKNRNFYANDILAHNKGGECVPSWGEWSDWGTCSNGQETRLRTDGCGSSQTEFRGCGCTPNWQCGAWNVCEESGGGTTSLSANNQINSIELLSSKNIGNNLVDLFDNKNNLNKIGGDIIPLAEGTITTTKQGTQNRTCIDLNQCGSDVGKPTESQQCILGVTITYSPQNTVISTSNNSNIPFSVSVSGAGTSSIDIKWYFDDVFQKGNSGVGSISSTFSKDFNKDSVVKVDITIGGTIQSISWSIHINVDITESKVLCTENWYCHWTSCRNNETYSYPEDCTDLNNCGTSVNRPVFRDCSCNPNIVCGDWSPCLAEYDYKNVLSGEPTISGTQSRECKDTRLCGEENSINIRECSISNKIKTGKTKWCYEDYIEIYDISSEKLIGRYKQSKDKVISSVNIGFVTSDYGGVCSYCFDRIKNFDETDVDCGGSYCPQCILGGKFFDYLIYIISLLWLLFTILVLILGYNNIDYNALKKLYGLPERNEEKLHELSKRIGKKLNRLSERIKKIRFRASAKPKKEAHRFGLRNIFSRIKLLLIGIKIRIGRRKEKKIIGIKEEKKIERKEYEKVKKPKKSILKLISSARGRYKEKREAKKAIRRERRHIKKQIRYVHKIIKKKAVHASEISALRKQLNEWKAKGYDTTDLQRKLDEYEGANPFK